MANCPFLAAFSNCYSTSFRYIDYLMGKSHLLECVISQD